MLPFQPPFSSGIPQLATFDYWRVNVISTDVATVPNLNKAIVIQWVVIINNQHKSMYGDLIIDLLALCHLSKTLGSKFPIHGNYPTNK